MLMPVQQAVEQVVMLLESIVSQDNELPASKKKKVEGQE